MVSLPWRRSLWSEVIPVGSGNQSFFCSGMVSTSEFSPAPRLPISDWSLRDVLPPSVIRRGFPDTRRVAGLQFRHGDIDARAAALSGAVDVTGEYEIVACV